MATLTPAQNSNEVDDISTGAGSQQKRPASSGNPNKSIIPGETKIAGIIPVKSIAVGSGPRNVKGARVYAGSEILIDVSDLNLYQEIYLLWQGHENKIFHFYPHTGLGKSGYVSFKVPQDLSGAIGDNSPVFVRLISNQPQFSGTVSYYLTFKKESEDQAEKRKAAEQASGQSSEGKAVTPGPTEMMMGAMGDVLGGIVGAVSGALKSTTDASSVGTKTISQSGTVNATNTKEVSSEGAVDEGGDYSEEVQQDIQETGGQTISESGTISTGGQTVSEGKMDVVGSGRGVPSAAEGTPLPTGVSSTISSQPFVTQKTSSSGGTTGTTSVSSRTISSGQTNAGGTMTGQMTTTGTQGAGGGAKVTETIKEDINLTGKTEVQTRQVPGSGGPTQASSAVSSPSTGLSGRGSATISSGGTAAMGMGLPTFGGGTTLKAPAGLGNILRKDAELNLSRNLNISSRGTPTPPAASKPAQGSTKPPGTSGKENEPTGAEVGEEPKKSDQTKAEEPAVGPKEENGGTPPSPEQTPKENPTDEARPISEAPPSPGVHPKQEPEDDTKVPPPLGQAGGLHGQKNGEPGDQKTGQPDRPIDSANGLKYPGGGNNLGIGDSEMGEPTQIPKVPEAGEGTPGLAPEAEQAIGDALPEAAAGAAEGAETGAGLGPEGALAGAALGALARSKTGQEILGRVGGQATSKIWYYGFGSSCATFFTGIDFMLGAVVMDAYWLFGHRKNPELFPLKGWQKIVTIAANVIPPILITLILALIMVAGCNWPVPAQYSKVVNYKLTVIGAFIGDDCKYFDVSNISGYNGGSAGGAGASVNWNASTTPSGPVTPR